MVRLYVSRGNPLVYESFPIFTPQLAKDVCKLLAAKIFMRTNNCSMLKRWEMSYPIRTTGSRSSKVRVRFATLCGQAVTFGGVFSHCALLFFATRRHNL